MSWAPSTVVQAMIGLMETFLSDAALHVRCGLSPHVQKDGCDSPHSRGSKLESCDSPHPLSLNIFKEIAEWTYKLKCCRGIWCNVWKWKNPSSKAFCVSFLTFLAGAVAKVHAFDCESSCFSLRLCARILCSPFTSSSSHMTDVDFCRLCGKMAVKVRIPFLKLFKYI